MKAFIYKGPGEKSLEERAVPKIDAPTDAIVNVTKTTIWGTDLHILRATYRLARRAASSVMKALAAAG